ncbi:1905_t:CDS:2 [Scutellospora calospora]|uniref:1905_t:CDS:1 n=1 Tax=Scutellospora calospora TaxID=85575 RepID=A0ACA9KIH4_9GLOM|nr:1905_t:CDS:2 [Scutellospora calospora]
MPNNQYNSTERSKNTLIIIAGGSGTGKTTVENLLTQDPNIAKLISTTTRPPRTGEKDGQDYYFISKETFQTELEKGRFLEHVIYDGNYYGIHGKVVDLILGTQNKHGVIIVDVDAESLEKMVEHMRKRGTSEPEIIRRLTIAEKEEKFAPEFDHILTIKENELTATVQKIKENLSHEITISGSPSKVIWLALGYFLAVVVICGLINYFLHKKDLKFQKQLEEQVKQETILVNQRDLLLKKNAEETYFAKYQQTLKRTRQLANEEDKLYTAAFVIPSYSLIKYSKYFFFPFVGDRGGYIAFNIFTDLFEAMKKMIERLRGYTYYFSAQKRLNELLAQPERNDIQKNILFAEPVATITFQKRSGQPPNRRKWLRQKHYD